MSGCFETKLQITVAKNGLPSHQFPSGSPTKTGGKNFLFLPIRRIFPAHLIPIDLLIIGEERRTRSFSLCGFLHLAFNSSLFGSHFILSPPVLEGTLYLPLN